MFLSQKKTPVNMDFLVIVKMNQLIKTKISKKVFTFLLNCTKARSYRSCNALSWTYVFSDFYYSYESKKIILKTSYTGPLSHAYALLKFIYSEKATKFCEISSVDLTVTTYLVRTNLRWRLHNTQYRL